MAGIQFNPQEKSLAYSVLARVNFSFRNVIANLAGMDKDAVIDRRSQETFIGFTRELQSLINCKFLAGLQDVEEKQAFEFGKIRIEREHYLNPDRPAFKQRNRRKK